MARRCRAMPTLGGRKVFSPTHLSRAKTYPIFGLLTGLDSCGKVGCPFVGGVHSEAHVLRNGQISFPVGWRGVLRAKTAVLFSLRFCVFSAMMLCGEFGTILTEPRIFAGKKQN